MSQYNEYVADGSTRLFLFRFAVFDRSDLQVSLDGVPQTAGWLPFGLGSGNGGGVEFATAPATGAVIRITRIEIPPQVPFLLRDENLADIQSKPLARTNLGVYSTSQTDDAIGSAAASVTASSLQKTANLSDVADVAQARANLGVPSAAGLAQTIADTALLKANNLSDLANAATARTNLGVAIGTDVQAFDADLDWVAANLTTAGKALLDGADAAAQRTTLDVYSKAQVDTAIANSGQIIISDPRFATLERNLALTVLRSQIDAGWSVLRMIDGIADEFEDTNGIASNTGSYDSTGSYVHNPGGYTADVTTSGQAISSGDYSGYPKGDAFDNVAVTNGSTQWRSSGNAAGLYIGQDFGSNRHIRRVTIRNGGGSGAYGVSSISLRWSNDGTTWTSVGTASLIDDMGGIVQVKDFPASGAHRYWAVFNETASPGYTWIVGEVEMMEMTVPADITVTSIGYTATAVPTEARMVLLMQEVNPLIFNTDNSIEVSRDNGTTWSTGTLSDQGAFDSTTRIVTAIVGLSAQPSGTSLRWRFKTFNSKEQRLHGVWMQWR